MAFAVTDDDETTKALPAPSEPPGHDDSGDTSDEIARLRDEISLRRQRLDSALRQLEHRVSEDLDWRRRVAAHPWLVLAAAGMAGFAVGRLVGGGRASRDRGELSLF